MCYWFYIHRVRVNTVWFLYYLVCVWEYIHKTFQHDMRSKIAQTQPLHCKLTYAGLI